MFKLISDQNFNARILRGLSRRVSNFDLVCALDVGLARVDDPVLLEWAAVEGRILLTHDVNTMPRFAYERVRAGLIMPGVFLISSSMRIGRAIDELTFVIEGSSQVRVHRSGRCKIRGRGASDSRKTGVLQSSVIEIPLVFKGPRV
jgi:hypothetical protein